MNEKHDPGLESMNGKRGPIGVFDSGMGGLTVVRALRAHLPNRSLIYYGDTIHLPYGEKSPEAIRSYAIAIVQFLKDRGCQAVVVACNSASAVAMDVLQVQFPDIVFYNVIDPVVAYITSAEFQRVGVIGTRATVQSGIYPAKIHESRPQIQIESLATPLLVPVIEEGFIHTAISKAVIEQYMASPQLAGMEVLVLGCTHYPLAYSEFRSILPDRVTILNTPEIVAQSIARAEGADASESTPTVQFFLSDYTQQFADLAMQFYGEPMDWNLQRLD